MPVRVIASSSLQRDPEVGQVDVLLGLRRCARSGRSPVLIPVRDTTLVGAGKRGRDRPSGWIVLPGGMRSELENTVRRSVPSTRRITRCSGAVELAGTVHGDHLGMID